MGWSDELQKTSRDNLAAYERSKRYRFQEQCFLNFWKAHIFSKLSIYNDGTFGRRRRKPPAIGAAVWQQPVDIKEEGGKSTGTSVYLYEHINTIDAKEPAKLVSVFNQKDGADIFLRLDSAVLTQLKPVVELYKIFPSIKQTADKQDETAPPPQVYKVPMFLGEHIRPDQEGLPLSNKNSSIEDLFHEHDILGNAMLTDLSFRFAGKNIALLNTVEDISFTLAFSSFNLFKHKFETTIKESPDREEKDFVWSYQDLISYSTKYLTDTNEKSVTPIGSESAGDVSCYETAESFVGNSPTDPNGDLNQKHFEIQMVVRYEPNDINWDMVASATSSDYADEPAFSEDDKKALESFLRNSAVVLRLQFVGHTIRYNSKSSGADPELLIDFEYKAFIESSFNSPDLDLFKLPDKAGRELLTWETKLYQARRLLYAVQREKLTLGAIFGAKGNLNTELKNQYQELRSSLPNTPEKSKGTSHDFQWLIWAPTSGDASKSLSTVNGLVPTEKDLEKAETKQERLSNALNKRKDLARRGQRTGTTDKFIKRARESDEITIRRGLQYNPDNLETVLGSTANARLVFRELVDNLAHYIKILRRTHLQEKYKNLFNALYAQERVYSVGIEKEQVGFDPGTRKKGDETVEAESEKAKERRKLLEDKTQLQLKPANTVKIVRDYFLRTPGDDDPLMKVINEYDKLKMDGAHAGLTNQMDTLAQSTQAGLAGATFSGPTNDGSGNVIYFTNLGDIIDVVITIASAPDYGLFKRRLGILLGPLLEQDNSAHFGPGKNHYIFNLAWVPVSLKTLMGFFATKVVASGKERYLLNDFIKDLVEHLILPALGSRCVEGAQAGNQQVGTLTFTSEMRKYASIKDASKRPIPPFYAQHLTDAHAWIMDHYPPGGGTQYLLMNNASQTVLQPGKPGTKQNWQKIPWGNGSIKKLTEVSPNTPADELFHYMLVYVNNLSPIRLRPEEEEKNIENGIYYLHLGQIPSIVKDATFKKENIPYVREARAMGQITKTGGIALRDVYRLQCSMYGNNIFKPGSLVFVDPTKDGSADYQDWRELGLVGFYRIVSVDHQINVGMDPSHETRIDAAWETFGSCGEIDGLIDEDFRNRPGGMQTVNPASRTVPGEVGGSS